MRCHARALVIAFEMAVNSRPEFTRAGVSAGVMGVFPAGAAIRRRDRD
jgi:hypothetical protein